MRKITRLGAHAASLALVVTGTALAVSPTQAATHDPVGVDQGATWLATQLSGGVVHNSQFDFDDYGLSADVAFALHAVGGYDSTVAQVSKGLEAGAHDKWYTFSDGTTTTTYAGSLAKLLVLVQTAAGDPTTYGGRNLVTLLSDRTSATGRISDENNAFGDANTIGQAFAARGLSTAGAAKAAEATSFLLDQQCPGGGFRLAFAPVAAADQTCTDDTQSETDVTAIALLQLKALGSNAAQVTGAITRATAWLGTAQRSDGSWGGGTSTSASNSNSTGLASWALGDTAASERGAQWLRARQVTFYDVCDQVGRSRGAVALNSDALTTGRRAGITTDNQDQWRRASAQAIPALAYLPVDAAPSAPVLTAPSGFFKQGSHPVLTTTGIKSGDQLCLNGSGAKAQGTAAGTTWRQAVTLPTGTATRSYAVRDAYGHVDSASIKVLGKRTLVVARTPGKVKRSRVITVAARGLAPREPARIFYGSRLVKTGTASSAGNLVARFSSGTSLGKKSIRAYGRFADIRKGATSVSVVR